MILNDLNQMCGFLPAEYKSLCTEAVTEYGRELIDAVIKYLADPSQVCNLIGLCNSTITSQREAFERLHQLIVLYANKGVGLFEKPRKLEGMNSCSLCEFIMDLVQTMLMDQPTRDFAHDEALKLCNFLPSSDVDECKVVVTTLEPTAYDTIVKRYLNPMTFCTGIEVCAPDEEE